MMAVSFTALLQNSLEFRRVWQAVEPKANTLSNALTGTDRLTLGLLLQVTGARSAWIGETRLSQDLLGVSSDDGLARPVMKAEPSTPFTTVQVLSGASLRLIQPSANDASSAERHSSTDLSCLTLIFAEGGVPVTHTSASEASDLLLRPIGSLAPALWASRLFAVVTHANQDAVDAVLETLRAALGDPGLDPLALYEQLQSQLIIDPEEFARLREEVVSLRASLADVQDHSRRFAVGGMTKARSSQQKGLNGAAAAHKPTWNPAVSAEPDTSDCETLRRQLSYAHNQIAFLTTYLGDQTPGTISDRDLLARSPLFDAGWYAKTYRVRPRAALDHFLSNGASGRFNPSSLFDCASYLAANSDVEAAMLNPLVHYLRHGAEEGRALSLTDSRVG